VTKRFSLKLGKHLESPDSKRFYNEQIFSEIAPRYDFITRALSFGRDAAWKTDLIAALPCREKPVCLDLACGTGDLSLLLADKYPQGRITGLDITESMLAIARARSGHAHVAFINQDMNKLKFDPNSADIVSGGYALRNAPDLESTMDEVNRVLKPGGIAVFLDFSKPPARFPQFLIYWGVLLHQNHEVYSYIAESLQRFPDRERLRRMFEARGFTVVRSRLYLLGIMELLVMEKWTPEPARNGAARVS
jgi:demethylmenaquinone methyltransferase/2-methoxy-6-polyprenyl-1,4-benzoquinol methylase